MMMKTVLKYFTLSVTCSLMLLTVGISQEKPIPPLENKSFPSANFKSEWDGIIILNPESVRKIDMIEKVQEEYVKKLYPGYHIILRIPIKDDKNLFVETLSLVNLEGKKALLHFDMTEVYKSLKSKDKETKLKIEELESNYLSFISGQVN